MINKISLLLFILMSQVIIAQNDFTTPYYRIEAKADSLVVPDRIYLHINLTESKSKKSTAELHSVLLKTLTNLNIDLNKQLSSLDFNSNHKKNWLKNQIHKSERYELLLYDAPSVAQTIDALKEQEIGDVYISSMEYSQKEKLINSLRVRAIKKAKANATQVVSSVGQSIGKVLRIEEYAQEASNMYAVRASAKTMAMDKDWEREDVSEFKKINFSIFFTIYFEIK